MDVGGSRNVNAVQQRAGVDTAAAQSATVGQAYFSGTAGPVGKDGSPLAVYHGTRDDIESFDLAHPNRKDVGWLGRGIYTSSSADQAGDYAEVKHGAGHHPRRSQHQDRQACGNAKPVKTVHQGRHRRWPGRAKFLLTKPICRDLHLKNAGPAISAFCGQD